MTCPFCPEEDSRLHRLLDCPAFHSVRQPYQPVLQQLQEYDHSMLWFPMILRHPDAEPHACLHDCEPKPEICQSAIDTANRMIRQGCVPKFFTDGSCMHSNHPTTRFTGFSVIMDLAVSDDQRIHLANKYLEDQKFPDALQLVASGKSFSEQSIPRAELQALVTVAEAIRVGEIHTDSSFALGIMHLIQRGCSFHAMTEKDSLDLITQLFQCDLQCLVFLKIKAHRNILEISDPLERYLAIGNAFADVCAGEACTGQNLPWVQSLQTKHEDVQWERDALKQLCQLHLALHRARQEAEQTVTELENSSAHVASELSAIQVQKAIVEWTPVTAVDYDSTYIPEEVRCFFTFGDRWLH